PGDRELQPDRTPTSEDRRPPDSARLRSRSARGRRPAGPCLRRAPAPPPPGSDHARSLGQAERTWDLTPQFGRGVAALANKSRVTVQESSPRRLLRSPHSGRAARIDADL